MVWVLGVKSCSCTGFWLSLWFSGRWWLCFCHLFEDNCATGTMEWCPVAFFRIWIGLLNLAVLSSWGLNHSVDLPEKAFSLWTWAKAHWISQQGSFWLRWALAQALYEWQFLLWNYQKFLIFSFCFSFPQEFHLYFSAWTTTAWLCSSLIQMGC